MPCLWLRCRRRLRVLRTWKHAVHNRSFETQFALVKWIILSFYCFGAHIPTKWHMWNGRLHKNGYSLLAYYISISFFFVGNSNKIQFRRRRATNSQRSLPHQLRRHSTSRIKRRIMRNSRTCDVSYGFLRLFLYDHDQLYTVYIHFYWKAK